MKNPTLLSLPDEDYAYSFLPWGMNTVISCSLLGLANRSMAAVFTVGYTG